MNWCLIGPVIQTGLPALHPVTSPVPVATRPHQHRPVRVCWLTFDARR